MAADSRARVLFLCTRNSCRSQMAEGFARAMHGGRIRAYSAGTVASSLNPLAVRAMAEVGIDISGQRSRSIDEVLAESKGFEVVVTVCDDAHEACPMFPGNAHVIHRAFDDPPRLAARAADEEEAMAHYRRVRDEIGAFVKVLASEIN